MNREEIDIAILPDGRIEYTIRGVKGATCENISDLLEALGTVEESRRTDEYYEDDQDVTINVQT